jgi:hypothetical protein
MRSKKSINRPELRAASVFAPDATQGWLDAGTGSTGLALRKSGSARKKALISSFVDRIARFRATHHVSMLSSFSAQGKTILHELCRVMGLPGKPDGISGADVEKFYLALDGRIREIAAYCESDVVNAYRVWLRN